jgi:hypothetical protein
MKSTLVLLACGLTCSAAVAQTYTAQILIEDLYWQTREEWKSLFVKTPSHYRKVPKASTRFSRQS